MLVIGEIIPAARIKSAAGESIPVARLAAIMAPELMRYAKLLLLLPSVGPFPGAPESTIGSCGSCSLILGES